MKPSRPGTYERISQDEGRTLDVTHHREDLESLAAQAGWGGPTAGHKMKTVTIATIITAAAVLATGCAGEDSPDPPASPTTQAPATTQAPSPTTSDPSPIQDSPTSSPGRTTQEPERSLPAECRHPPGGSVRQSCIEEYGPEGVGTVEPPEPSPDETDDAPGVPPREEQIQQCIEQTGEPEACREKIDPEGPTDTPTGQDGQDLPE